MIKISPRLLPHLFLVSAALAALQCFARSDYNLPLMLFAFVTWDSKKVRECQNGNLTFYRNFIDKG